LILCTGGGVQTGRQTGNNSARARPLHHLLGFAFSD
jgi:hypothetical protein